MKYGFIIFQTYLDTLEQRVITSFDGKEFNTPEKAFEGCKKMLEYNGKREGVRKLQNSESIILRGDCLAGQIEFPRTIQVIPVYEFDLF